MSYNETNIHNSLLTTMYCWTDYFSKFFLFINLTIGIVSITGWLKSSIKIIVIANHITTRNPKRFGR